MENQISHVVDYTVLIGAVVTGFFTLSAVYLTHRINSSHNQKLQAQANEKERNRVRLLKAEQLYVKFEKWSSSMGNVCFKALHLSQVVEQNELLEKSMENVTTVKDEFIEIRMLVDIHFPELKADLDAVFDARNKCVDLMPSLQGNYLAMKTLENEMTVFDSVSELFKKEVALVASSL
ncbi:hypothetical protein [Vibrio parahaemolyticus]|uniref:hypothetical protein n=1 Tax=Vibrio parahaemolyticus TaxID=670 RepID=UPI001A248CCA|nr:hypothetical protein [Vibrio parahaemolyticus]EGR0400060.1 hypothetical protein [Vibrio parahaemolyticus]MCI9721338.1 hypothetical protein [Vibrio parahaemolyticus]HAS6434535.1 hypothetical protein [Vibrio parahaemolyticus]HAS6853994.1 hypothetical protein [Vibrio parahaemolyticus]HAS6962276.1 hypothetical protein [Vibrio parahaemolyticus]